MKILFRGKLFTLYNETLATPQGRRVTYERCRRPASVVLIPFLNADTLLILREYRIALGRNTWRLPSGRVDHEGVPQNRILNPKLSKDLAILQSAAHRELQEETGFRAEKLTHYRDRFTGESIKAPAHIFIAQNLIRDPLPRDADETITVHKIPFERAYRMAISGAIEEELMALSLIRLFHEQTRSLKKN